MIKKVLSTTSIIIAGKLLSMVLGVILARNLGPSEFGLYSYIMSIMSLVVAFCILGIPNLIVREVSKYIKSDQLGELKGFLRWSLFLLMKTSLIAIFTLFTWIFLWGDNVESVWLLVALIIPLRVFEARGSYILNGLKEYSLSQIPRNVIAPLISLLIIGALYLYTDLSIGYIIFTQLLSTIFAFLSIIFILKNKFIVLPKDCKPIYLKKSWNVALISMASITIISTINIELAPVAIGFLATKEEVGYFKIAMQGVALVSMSLYAINIVIGPQLAALNKNSDNYINDIQVLLTKSVRLSALISLPVISLLFIAGDDVVLMFFGEDYLPVTPILIILCLGQLIDVLMGSTGMVLLMTGNEKESIKLVFISLLVNIVLMAIFTPFYGAIGAAWSVTISIFVWNALAARYSYKNSAIKTWIR